MEIIEEIKRIISLKKLGGTLEKFRSNEGYVFVS